MAKVRIRYASIEEIKASVVYYPDSGEFYWVKRGVGIRWKSAAGSLTPNGYLRIRVDCDTYLCHRLAWFYMTGKWPEHYIDHIDGNRSNNRWDNLRQATTSQNHQNKIKRKNTITGLKGVTRNLPSKKWRNPPPFRATIVLKGKSKCLGNFHTAEDAHKAYREAAILEFGDYARME